MYECRSHINTREDHRLQNISYSSSQTTPRRFLESNYLLFPQTVVSVLMGYVNIMSENRECYIKGKINDAEHLDQIYGVFLPNIWHKSYSSDFMFKHNTLLTYITMSDFKECKRQSRSKFKVHCLIRYQNGNLNAAWDYFSFMRKKMRFC